MTGVGTDTAGAVQVWAMYNKVLWMRTGVGISTAGAGRVRHLHRPLVGGGRRRGLRVPVYIEGPRQGDQPRS